MPNQLVNEISQVLERVVHNQKRLNDLAMDESQTYPMEALQTSQAILISELTGLEQALKKAFAPNQYQMLPSWLNVNKQAKTFGELNRRFTDVLSVRMGLIKNELTRVRQGKKALDKMKKTYVSQNISYIRPAKKVNQVH